LLIANVLSNKVLTKTEKFQFLQHKLFYKNETKLRLMKKLINLIIPVVLITSWFFSVAANNQAEKKEHIVVCVGFYNVENLFDTINSPGIFDEDFTPQGSKQWNSWKYMEKLDRLGEVISKMGADITPDGPAVLGLCEVENRAVLVDLANNHYIKDRNYQVVHYTGPDRRGIDVALLYQPKYFNYISSKPYPTVVPDNPGFRTRDQLLVTGELLGERIHFIVSHWPSRGGGERRSRPMRIAAADIARSIVDSIQAAEPGAKVILMGDYNDDPSSRSIRHHLRAHGNLKKLQENELFNPFEDLYNKGIGSLAWRDSWNLFDMHLLTPSLVGNDRGTFKFHRAFVYNPPYLRQPTGRFQGYPFRSYSGDVYQSGYSDHFPTYVFLIREVINPASKMQVE